MPSSPERNMLGSAHFPCGVPRFDSPKVRFTRHKCPGPHVHPNGWIKPWVSWIESIKIFAKRCCNSAQVSSKSQRVEARFMTKIQWNTMKHNENLWKWMNEYRKCWFSLFFLCFGWENGGDEKKQKFKGSELISPCLPASPLNAILVQYFSLFFRSFFFLS